MNAVLKPIETHYKGYRFRSRLEARWAVYFDLLHISWEYEPEGFQLPDGQWYLPDFRVQLAYCPSTPIGWYEVRPKGSVPDSKWLSFTNAFKDVPATFLAGDPVDVIQTDLKTCPCPRCGFVGQSHLIDYDKSSDRLAYYCWPCDCNTPSGGGNPLEKGLLADVEPYKGSLHVSGGEIIGYVNGVFPPALKARGARFGSKPGEYR